MNAPWKVGGVANRLPFLAFASDEASADAIRPIASEMGWSSDNVHQGGLRKAVQTLSVSTSPHVLFVDLTGSGDPLSDINGLAEVCEPGTVVIAAGQVNDVRLYRDLLASGIQDYLLKPFSADMLRDSFAQAQAIINAPKITDATNARPHCAIAVIGTRGGAGASRLGARGGNRRGGVVRRRHAGPDAAGRRVAARRRLMSDQPPPVSDGLAALRCVFASAWHRSEQ